MITIKTPDEIERLRESGRRLAKILKALREHAKSGVSGLELDQLARKLAAEGGDKPSFLDYKPKGAKTSYPAAICFSVNDEVVHGIPTAEKILKDGDIVGIDMGLIHKGMITDSAVTVAIGKIDAEAEKILKVTTEALSKGIAAAKAGHTTGDIGFAVESFVKPHGYGIIRELCGHGVGYKVHEDPFIPNYGNKGEGAQLKPGMVIAIEPMLNEGGREIILDSDGYTWKTKDGKRSAHFEHTIVIGENGPEIVTKI